MIYRITFGFAGKGQGWGETHAMISNFNNPRDTMPALKDIASKRAQMLGREFEIVAIRVARYATEGGVRQRGVYLEKGSWKNQFSTEGYGAEPAAVALLAKGYAVQSQTQPQFNANISQTFLGAPIDECVDNGGKVYEGKRSLGANFASWRGAMIAANLGWLAADTILDVPILTIAQNANGTVRLTMPPLLVPTLTVGQAYRARVRQVNSGVSPLNGEIVLRVFSETQLDTLEVIGLGLMQSGGFVRVYRQVQPFIGYSDLVLQGVAAKHKRGRPFGSSPGRARKRVRG